MEDSASKTVVQYCCSAPNCGKVYNTRFNLKRHIDITHLKKKKFRCPVCDGSFASHQSLREHQNLHSGAKPFVCPNCNSSFRQASQLSLHKRTHELESAIEDQMEVESQDEEQETTEILTPRQREAKLPLPPLLSGLIK